MKVSKHKQNFKTDKLNSIQNVYKIRIKISIQMKSENKKKSLYVLTIRKRYFKLFI